MKISKVTMFSSLVLATTLLTACGGGSSNSLTDQNETSSISMGSSESSSESTEISSISTDSSQPTTDTSDTLPELSTGEIQSLLFMREEEELARDLYLDIYAAKDNRLKIFKNISDNAETKHAAAMLVLLNTYGIEDPSTGEHNTYTNPELQNLYNQLFSDAIGSDDLAALRVGALVEETDIQDIATDMTQTSNDHQDILTTYENLLCGSKNHLRSFVKQIENLTGTDYVIQVPGIADVINNVLSTPQEQCGR